MAVVSNVLIYAVGLDWRWLGPSFAENKKTVQPSTHTFSVLSSTKQPILLGQESVFLWRLSSAFLPALSELISEAHQNALFVVLVEL
jgi:hypothetical protein